MKPTHKTPDTNPAFDSPEQEVFLNLWRTYDCLRSLEDRAMGEFGVSAQQYNALRLLEGVHPSPLPTLALGKKLICRSPDITRLLDRLEVNGWVARSRDAGNRRVVAVNISDEGIKLLKRMRRVIVAMHQQQLGHMSASQQKTLVKLLKVARRPHDDSSCNWLED